MVAVHPGKAARPLSRAAAPRRPRSTLLRVLVTAGPTREFWDPVRYLSNASTGRMGYACAEAALRRGHQVTLVTGPCDLPPPAGARVVRVESARDMQQALRRAYPRCDGVMMAAAVADYRPATESRAKVHKGKPSVTLRLVRNPDLLYDMGREKGNRTLLGFALEDRDPKRRALRKLREKRLDFIVCNGPAAIGHVRADVTILGPGGPLRTFRGVSKRRLAEVLVRLVEQDQHERRAHRG